jgi:hypothetical protein
MAAVEGGQPTAFLPDLLLARLTMHDSLKAHFASFEKSVQSTSIAEDRKEYITATLQKLPAVYEQYRLTNSSRFGDEITRMVQTILKNLEACPQSRGIDQEFRDGLRNLHEELGVPVLRLKAPAPLPKKRKASAA